MMLRLMPKAIDHCRGKLPGGKIPKRLYDMSLRALSDGAGALYWSQISKIVFGARDEQRGFMTMGTNCIPQNDCSFRNYGQRSAD